VLKTGKKDWLQKLPKTTRLENFTKENIGSQIAILFTTFGLENKPI